MRFHSMKKGIVSLILLPKTKGYIYKAVFCDCLNTVAFLSKSPNRGSSACCQNIHLLRERKWHFRFARSSLADWLLITSFPTCPSMGILYLRWLFWEWLLGRLLEKLAGNYRREGNGILLWEDLPSRVIYRGRSKKLQWWLWLYVEEFILWLPFKLYSCPCSHPRHGWH